MSRYRFRRDDSGVEVVFELSRSEFARECRNGKLRRASKLGGGQIVFSFLREETPLTADQVRSGITVFQHPSTYPMKSDVAGINPSQIAEAREHDRLHGLNVDYDAQTGEVIFPDRTARRRYCEFHGMFDRNGSYSDPQTGKFSPRDD